MRWLVFLDIFILLYQLTNAKPVTPTQKRSETELIREKRGQLEDDEGTDEMQKFILDLSAKEDMRRLNERFRTVIPRDIESDVEYRRLKRFSIHDTGDRHDESSSGKVTMEMRSSRTSREDEDITSPETGPSLQTNKRSTEPKIPSQERRSNGILVQVLSKRNSDIKDNRAAEPSNSKNVQGPKSSGADKTSNVSDSEKNDLNKNIPSYKYSEIIDHKSPAKDNRDVNGPEFGNEFDNLNSGRSDSSEDTAVNPTAGSHVNHHLVGDSWELVHHDPRSTTGSLPSLTSVNNALHSSSNATIHREYLNDDVIDDVDQYKRTKLRRKPRFSKIRVVRSIEPEYEVQEISAVYNAKSDSPDENSARVIALDKRSIKRDGYIGCFVDQHPNRDLIKSFSVSSLTPDSCRLVCKQKGHAYAGVQYGYLCHCGDDYGKYGHAGEGECNSICQGDEGKKCGGFWRNSIYAADIFPKDEDGENSERESRSHIDRIIPITESEENEEAPVRQEITAYLRVHIPQRPDQTISTQTGRLSQKSASSTTAASSKRTETPSPKSNIIDHVAYLHPQNIHRSFIPSNIVLKKLKPVPGKKTYTGTVKLKQNWHDNLKNKKSPKTLILAGNIESAFREMFATDNDFEEAQVLGFREAAIRNDPSTVHKVLVEFALTFGKVGIGKDEKLRHMVEESSRLDDMPVFGNTIQVKEYTDKEEQQDFTSSESKSSDEEVPKDTREAPYENQLEDDKQNGVDPFLEKVFSQI